MMDDKLIVEALRAATGDVFSTMLGLDIVELEPYDEIKAPGPSKGLIGVIGLAGAWIGTANICCSSHLACQLSSAMLGAEYAEVDEDVLDAISEIVNMIVGGFKTTAETHLGPLGLSLPTVIYGLSFSARTAGKEKWVVAPFACGDEKFEIKICLAPNRGLPRSAVMAPAHAELVSN